MRYLPRPVVFARVLPNPRGLFWVPRSLLKLPEQYASAERCGGSGLPVWPEAAPLSAFGGIPPLPPNLWDGTSPV